MKTRFATLLFVVMAGMAGAAWLTPTGTAEEKLDGQALFTSAKFKCDRCHGADGMGGRGPSFKGVGKKYDRDQLMERSAHRCPPSGACSPAELGAIVDWLRTL